MGGRRQQGASRAGPSRPTPAGCAWLRCARACPCSSLPPPPPLRCPPTHCCWSSRLPLLPPPPPPCPRPHALVLHVSGWGGEKGHAHQGLSKNHFGTYMFLPPLREHFGPLELLSLPAKPVALGTGLLDGRSSGETQIRGLRTKKK